MPFCFFVVIVLFLFCFFLFVSLYVVCACPCCHVLMPVLPFCRHICHVFVPRGTFLSTLVAFCHNLCLCTGSHIYFVSFLPVVVSCVCRLWFICLFLLCVCFILATFVCCSYLRLYLLVCCACSWFASSASFFCCPRWGWFLVFIFVWYGLFIL